MEFINKTLMYYTMNILNIKGIIDGETIKWNSQTQQLCVPQVLYTPNNTGEPNFIIVLTGQSNSQGIGGRYDLNNSNDQSHNRIMAWNQGYIDYAIGYPWFQDGGNIGWEVADLQNTIGTKLHNDQCFAFHFAKHLVNAYNDIVVGIINCGLGAQRIARWAIFPETSKWYKYNINYWRNQGDIFELHKCIIDLALSKIQHKHVNAILWHQGESDGDWEVHGQNNTNPDYYKNALQQVIHQYRSLQYTNPHTPFIVGETTGADYNGSNVGWEARNIQLRELNIDSDLYTKCVHTADLPFSKENGFDDYVHFSSESHRKMGLRYLLKYKEILAETQ